MTLRPHRRPRSVRSGAVPQPAGRCRTGSRGYLTVVAPGAWLDYTLYWRAPGPSAPTQNYHGFVHLVNGGGQMLTGHDQLPGDGLRPPVLWDLFSDQPDHYDMQIPVDAPSGLFWPHVGVYRAGGLALLPARPAGPAPWR